MGMRVLLLSWEYPPVIEGGLARHVRKLAEALVRAGASVDVLTRGVERDAEVRAEDVAGVRVYRVPEPGWPRDLDRFVAWVERMNEDMLAAGETLGEAGSYDLVHGHDSLLAHAPAALADRLGAPYPPTIPPTSRRPPPGLVAQPP